MFFLSALMIALSAFLGGFTGSMEQAHTQAPEQATQAPTQDYTFDAPSDWVCAVDSTTECSDVLALDAAQTLIDLNVTTAPEIADKMAITYIGTSDHMTTAHSVMEFSYESIDFPGTFHHYAYKGYTVA